MSGYTIEIHGSSNDSNFVLASESGSIIENASATDLTPLTTRVNTLETSMNSVDTNVNALDTNVTTIDDTLIANYLGSKMFGPSSMDFAIKLSNNGKKMMWYRPLTGATKPSSKFGAASFFNDLSNAWKEAEYDFDSIVYKPAENMIVLTVNEISFNPVTPTGETSPGFTRISYKMAYDLNTDQLIGYLSDFKFKYTTAQWNDLSNQQGIYAPLAFYIPGYITQAQFDAYVASGNTVESNGLKHYQNNLMSDIYYYVTVNYPEVSNSEGIGGFYSRYSMNEVEQHLATRSDYKLSSGKGDIIYISDVVGWGSVKVVNYIVAKLIQQIYPNKSVVPSNGAIGGYTLETEIHEHIGLGNVNVPAFDAEFWGNSTFTSANSDITNGRNQNIILSNRHSALQKDGFYVPDWVLDSGLPGTADLSNIIRASNFNSNWGATPPTGLIDAINAVIASNPGFATYYAAPTAFGHAFESQLDFSNLGINVTVSIPDTNDGLNGYINYIQNLYARGIEPTTITGNNLFWGFAWIPLWISDQGTTFIWSPAAETNVKKVKGPLFETLFPAATAMYDAVDFTDADIAAFSNSVEMLELTPEAVGDQWILDNSGATTDRVNTWLNATTITTRGRTQQLRTDVNIVETMVGLNDSVFQLDNKLNGGVPMLNSAIPVDDPSINLTSLIWTDDPSNIRLKQGGEISSVYNDNALGQALDRQCEDKPFFTITKDSTTLAEAYGNKMYVVDIMASKPFGFADTRPSEFPANSGYAWWGSMYQQRMAKDICDNYIFVLGGGNIMTSSNGVAGRPAFGTDASYNFNHYKFVFSSECVLNADISSSSYITTGPLAHSDLYSIDSNKELLLTRGRNIYIDANEKMELFDPLNTLLKASDYPIYGIMEFDISVNESVFINDVSGFAFSLNDFKIKDTMGNILGASDASFNDDLNVMCFGCALGGSNFNYSGGLHVLGDVADVTRARYDFGLTVVGAINGNYNFATKELEGKQNMYLNIVADESSKLALLNNKTVLVSWDTAKPNAPKYFSLLPELMGNKISMMNKEMVMQI